MLSRHAPTTGSDAACTCQIRPIGVLRCSHGIQLQLLVRCGQRGGTPPIPTIPLYVNLPPGSGVVGVRQSRPLGRAPQGGGRFTHVIFTKTASNRMIRTSWREEPRKLLTSSLCATKVALLQGPGLHDAAPKQAASHCQCRECFVPSIDGHETWSTRTSNLKWTKKHGWRIIHVAGHACELIALQTSLIYVYALQMRTPCSSTRTGKRISRRSQADSSCAFI